VFDYPGGIVGLILAGVGGKLSRDMKLTTHSQLVNRSRSLHMYIHTLIYLHGAVLNFLDQVEIYIYISFVYSFGLVLKM
jgi:hypothetical protein